MNPSFDEFLQSSLQTIKEENLYRTLKTIHSPQGPEVALDGKTYINFSSNDYLGLANHPAVHQAYADGLASYGVGSGASRLICGNFEPQESLEKALALFKQAESALVFSTGYATALGTLTALLTKVDTVIMDKLCHASLIDGVKLSGATLRIFPHNDLGHAEKLIIQSQTKGTGKILLIVESVYSMDGDLSPLADLVALKTKYNVWMMVDEAHGTGVFGPHGRGLAAELGLSGQIDIQMGTLGKALGTSGGFIVGSKSLREYLINKARSFIFSTAPSPALAHATMKALEICQSTEGDQLRARLFRSIEQLESGLKSNGDGRRHAASPIIPIILNDEGITLKAASALNESGFLVPAIRYPTVGRGKARLRVTLTAGHTPDMVHRLLVSLNQV